VENASNAPDEAGEEENLSDFTYNLRKLQSIMDFDDLSSSDGSSTSGSSTLPLDGNEFKEKYIDILGEFVESGGECGRHMARAVIISASVTPSNSHLILTRLQYNRPPIAVRIPLTVTAQTTTTTAPPQASEPIATTSTASAPTLTTSRGTGTKAKAAGTTKRKMAAASEEVSDSVTRTKSRASVAKLTSSKSSLTSSISAEMEDLTEQPTTSVTVAPAGGIGSNWLANVRQRIETHVGRFKLILNTGRPG